MELNHRKNLNNNRYSKQLSDENNNQRESQASTINVAHKLKYDKKPYGCYLVKLSQQIKNKSLSMMSKCLLSDSNNKVRQKNNNTDHALVKVKIQQGEKSNERIKQRRIKTQHYREQANLFQQIELLESHNTKANTKTKTQLMITSNPMISNFTKINQHNKLYRSLNHNYNKYNHHHQNQKSFDLYVSSIITNEGKQQQEQQQQTELVQFRKTEMSNVRGRVNNSKNKCKRWYKDNNNNANYHRRMRLSTKEQTYQSDIIKSKLKLNANNRNYNIQPQQQQQIRLKTLSDCWSTIDDQQFRSNTIIQSSSLYTLAAFYRSKGKQQHANYLNKGSKINNNRTQNNNNKTQNNNNKLFIPSLLVKDRSSQLTVFDNLMKNIEKGSKSNKHLPQGKSNNKNRKSRQFSIIQNRRLKNVQNIINHQQHKLDQQTGSKSQQQQIQQEIYAKSSQRNTRQQNSSIKKYNNTRERSQIRNDQRFSKIGKIVKQQINDKTELLCSEMMKHCENSQNTAVQQHDKYHEEMNNLQEKNNQQPQKILFIQQQQKHEHEHQHQLHHQLQQSPIAQLSNNQELNQTNQNHQPSTIQQIQQLTTKRNNNEPVLKKQNQDDNCAIY